MSTADVRHVLYVIYKYATGRTYKSYRSHLNRYQCIKKNKYAIKMHNNVENETETSFQLNISRSTTRFVSQHFGPKFHRRVLPIFF